MSNSTSPQFLLQAVLESFVDGILVLTDRQELHYANATAQQLCFQLTQKVGALPEIIWQACEALIDSRDLYPNQPIVLESEVESATVNLRIRVQWLQLDTIDRPYLLVRLQDQHQATQRLAIAEAQTWKLSPRETEVWLHRRASNSRKQIAIALYITEDTVKKHLKNIQIKRQFYIDMQDCRVTSSSGPFKVPCFV
ncbi:helix-turn-helix transcriptional regulator [Phormidium sp. CLA17]|uniref:helix-turn-helix transcriptional regulator n=1 Tax=Leptolyngbya sp. Cla-17 TaxID=2803751 RepID=UPI0019323042|nr:LuxR C-terminal-related transcriptional regulator [Leptolyngbya sp. Cla-17]MBM0743886.1 helix-turn-helix transcriptional regulator [Leptolyngbya sp. Cla-17]